MTPQLYFAGAVSKTFVSVEDDIRASSLIRIAAELPQSGTVADLRAFVSRTLGVPAGSFVFADVYVGK